MFSRLLFIIVSNSSIRALIAAIAAAAAIATVIATVIAGPRRPRSELRRS